jgi:hypothetical protein
VLPVGKSFVKSHRARNYEIRAVPGSVAFELWRATDNAAIDHFDVWSGGGEVLVRFSRCAWTHSVQIQEVKRIAALLEIGTCSSGDDTVCDGFRVTLRGDGEDVVGLIA